MGEDSIYVDTNGIKREILVRLDNAGKTLDRAQGAFKPKLCPDDFWYRMSLNNIWSKTIPDVKTKIINLTKELEQQVRKYDNEGNSGGGLLDSLRSFTC